MDNPKESIAPNPSALTDKKPKQKLVHPRYSDMVVAALSALKKPRGASRQAISNYISANYSVGSSVNRHISTALKSLVDKKSLTRTKGVGAAGSFKINKEAGKVKKNAAGRKSKSGRKPLKKTTKKRSQKKRVTKRRSPVRRRKATKSAKRKPVKKLGRKKVKPRRRL